MKKPQTANKLLLALGTMGVLVTAGDAGVVRVGHYGLGEAGTVTGTTSPYTPLIDDAGTPNNFTFGQFAGGNVATIGSLGVSAPGSTAFLTKTNDAGWAGTNFSLTDDWALQLWMRPDTTVGTIQFESDNSAAGVSIWFQNQGDGDGSDIAFGHGIGGGTNATSGNLFDYTSGTWYKIGIVRYNGVNNYYVNGGSPLASDTQVGTLGNMLIGFAASGTNGGGGAYDELNVWTFDHTADSRASVEAVMAAVPEPSSAVALVGGLLLLGLRRRLRAGHR